MNKKLMTALSTPAIFAALAFGGLASAATYSYDVGVSDGTQSYSALYTETAWQTLVIPLSEIGNTVPGDLSLSTSGLPDGVSITLTGSEVRGDNLVLSVDTERTSTATSVNTLANLTLMSGTTALTSFQIPVLGAATSDF